MNFIGDSVARNHMESLLCLLLMEETPKDIYLMAKFLGAGLERTHANQTGTGIYYLDIDK
ncbi:PC-Esterase, partial [Arabidopsis thaliana x Arabidopsis arenosa]